MKKLILAFSLIIFAVACNRASDVVLPEGEYKYISGVDKSAEITIAFDTKEKRFYGTSGVNRYFGSYEQDGSNISFSPVGTTMMAGPENLMKAEREYLGDLAKVNAFKIEDKDLILKTPNDGSLIFHKVE